QNCKTDKAWIKLLVVIAVVFEVLAAGCGLISIIQHGTSQDRDNNSISSIFKVDAIGPTLGAVTAMAAQTFFAHRCTNLLPKRYRMPFAAFIGAVIVAGFAGALGTTVVEYVNHGNTDVTRGASPQAYGQLYDLAMVWLWCNAGGDMIISCLLILRLWQTSKTVQVVDELREEQSKTEALIHSLMRLSFETAALTSVCAIAAAACYVTLTETTNTSYAFTDMLPGLYALSLLWALNSRHRLAPEVEASRLGEQIQLVWNLAEQQTTEGMDKHMKALANGDGRLAVSLHRGHAPPKAVSQLGHSVRMLTIADRKEIEAEEEDEFDLESSPRSFASEKKRFERDHDIV
ncbi:hypothetical protein MNV49_006014, partial [Pseudohyphozyma bogoriensis]